MEKNSTSFLMILGRSIEVNPLFRGTISCLFAAILLWISGNLHGQNIEDLRTDLKQRVAKPLQLNGSIALTLGYYESFGIAARRDKYSYSLFGNLNARILGIDCPINGNFSQLEASFLQPFNQFGLSPQYKFIKGHLGRAYASKIRQKV